MLLPGDAPISRDPADRLLPPLRSLTAVFGMGTGVASSLWPPGILWGRGPAGPVNLIRSRVPASAPPYLRTMVP